MNLTQAVEGNQYTVLKVDTANAEMNEFLFTLGCYESEKITVVAKVSGTYIVVIKDGRYSIDENLAKSITVQ